MKIEKIFELPIFSHLIEDGVKMYFNGLDVILSFNYFIDDIKKNMKITFPSALAYKYTDEYATEKLYEAYDKLVKIENSDWIDSLKQLQNRGFDFSRLSHYAIYFDSVGLFQFIAYEYTICETELE